MKVFKTNSAYQLSLGELSPNERGVFNKIKKMIQGLTVSGVIRISNVLVYYAKDNSSIN